MQVIGMEVILDFMSRIFRDKLEKEGIRYISEGRDMFNESTGGTIEIIYIINRND